VLWRQQSLHVHASRDLETHFYRGDFHIARDAHTMHVVVSPRLDIHVDGRRTKSTLRFLSQPISSLAVRRLGTVVMPCARVSGSTTATLHGKEHTTIL